MSAGKTFLDLINAPEILVMPGIFDGFSARLVEKMGFKAASISGAGLSESLLGWADVGIMGYEENVRASGALAACTSIPLQADGDTGYGNFNSMRRLVRKLEQRGIAGVCIEDKLFPKTNSFIRGKSQPLAEPEEFCGKIRAGKDAQLDDDFVIIARVEALIAGWRAAGVSAWSCFW